MMRGDVMVNPAKQNIEQSGSEPRFRYLVFEVMSKKEVALPDVVQAIWQSSNQLFGEAGTAEFQLWIPANLYDKSKRRGLVRCTHDNVEKVRSVIASIKEVGSEPAILKVVGVTGTIRAAKRKYFGVVDLRAYEHRK